MLTTLEAPSTPTSLTPANGRITILDQLRGLCLAIIIVDHIDLFPSAFEALTGRGLLWVTAAEGFFLISGLLVGLIRRRQAEREGFRAAAVKIWKRAGRLWGAAVVLTLLYTGLAYLLNDVDIQGSKDGLAYFGTLPQLFLHTVTLTYSYGWSDFLRYYVVYMALAPVALWLLRRRQWWLVVGPAVALWVLPVTWATLPHWIGGLRWQVYFFVGLAIGYYFDQIQAWWRARAAAERRRWEWGLFIAAGAGLAASAMITLWPIFWPNVSNVVMDTLRAIDGNGIYRLLFANDRSGVLRLPFFLVVFAAAYLLFQRYQPFVQRYLNWLLEPLGRNSLYVYIVQGAVVFGVRLMELRPAFWLNTFVEAAAILGIWYLVRRRFLFKVIPR